MGNRAMFAGAGTATAGALVILASVGNRTVDRAADAVLMVALLALSRAAFKLVDLPDAEAAGAERRREAAARGRPRAR